jgi:hypothetical protein
MAATPANSLTRISSGLQDSRLQTPKGNPRTEQFVKVLRKTTRWAAQWRRVEFDGSPEFGQKVSITLPRIAELVNGVMLVVTMPDIQTPQLLAQSLAGDDFLGPYFGWTNSLGHALIQTVELQIGGAIVETLDGRLLEVLDELYEPVETLKAKNAMIARAPTGFGPQTWISANQTVYIPLPFWFSKPGVLSHALPLDALSADKVQIHVTFRPVTQLYYTDARWDSRTPGYQNQTAGAMMELISSPFWVANPAATSRVYSVSANIPVNGISGEILPDITMPAVFKMASAHCMIEYISVEEPEAIALRSAELTYRVEQHNVIPVQPTQGVKEVRLSIPLTNPTKEVLWVFQRPEAESYNAWFLFSREISAYIPARLGAPNPCLTPWWPDAELTPLQENSWKILPAFRSVDSEPIEAVSMYYNSYERFIHESGSLFRSLIPSLHAVKAPVHDRYIYMWPFGLREANSLEEKRTLYEPQGLANWDKVPRKEMYFSMRRERNCGSAPNLNLYCWTTVWNVFKVYGGRGGFLFTN